MGPRRRSDAVVRPLNFTVRRFAMWPAIYSAVALALAVLAAFLSSKTQMTLGWGFVGIGFLVALIGPSLLLSYAWSQAGLKFRRPTLKRGIEIPWWRDPLQSLRASIVLGAGWVVGCTFGGLAASDATPMLEMHPQDAARRALADGELVKVWNESGEVLLPLHITKVVRPGVVCSEKGAWLRTSHNGQTVSALAPTHKADLAEGACFNDARVEVQRADGASRYPGTAQR